MDSIFNRAKWTVAPATAFGAAAAILYPGGNPLDATSERYSITRNFLSDLGMTVAYNGQPNRLGAACFIASLLILMAGLGTCLLAIIRLYTSEPGPRFWARSAGLCGLLACVAFTGVAATPENRAMAAHVGFTVWGWRILPAIAALMAIATMASRRLPRSVTIAWAVLAVLLTGYSALIVWSPGWSAVSALVIAVVAQKAATVIVVAALLYLAWAMDTIKPVLRAQ